ncbi:MAG: GAF domain-containing protein [Chloroflexota bacterium]
MGEDAQTLRYLQKENVRLRSDNATLQDYVGRLLQAVKALTDLQDRLDSISSETNVYNLIKQVLTLALAAVGSENGTLMLVDEETRELVFVEVIGEARDKLLHFRLAEGEGIASWVVSNRKSRIVADVHNDPQYSAKVDAMTGFNTHSIVCVPLVDGQRSIGAIELVNTSSGRPFTDSDRDILQLVARLASVAIVLAERETV